MRVHCWLAAPAELSPQPGPLPELAALVPAELKATLAGIGQAVAALHDGGLVHGDLTTSNMLVRESDNTVVSMSQCLAAELPGHRRTAALAAASRAHDMQGAGDKQRISLHCIAPTSRTRSCFLLCITSNKLRGIAQRSTFSSNMLSGPAHAAAWLSLALAGGQACRQSAGNCAPAPRDLSALQGHPCHAAGAD